MISRRFGVVAIAFATIATVACTSAKAPKRPDLPPLETKELSSITQGPGARWVIALRPKVIFSGELGAAMSKVSAKDGFAQLEKHLGFDVRTSDDALIVGYATSTFYAAHLAEGASPGGAVDALEKRLMDPSRASPRADVVMAWGSLPSGAPAHAIGMWSTRGDVVVGDVGRRPGPAIASLALSMGKLPIARSLAKQAPFDSLSTFAGDAELAISARCPLTDVLPSGKNEAPVVAQECDGAVLTFRPSGQGKLTLALHVTGRWGSDAPSVQKEVSAALDRVIASDLGRLLGLRDVKPEVTATKDAVDATMLVDAGTLAAGLHDLIEPTLGGLTK